MTTQAQNPLKWLLAQLPAEIEPARLTSLMERYWENKRDYERLVKIRTVERTIKTIQFRNNPNDQAKLVHWHAKLAKLKEVL